MFILRLGYSGNPLVRFSDKGLFLYLGIENPNMKCGIIFDVVDFFTNFPQDIKNLSKNYYELCQRYDWAIDYYLLKIFSTIHTHLFNFGYSPILFYVDSDFDYYLMSIAKRHDVILTDEVYKYDWYSASIKEREFFSKKAHILFPKCNKGVNYYEWLLKEANMNGYKIISNFGFQNKDYEAYINKNRYTYELKHGLMQLYDEQKREIGEAFFIINLAEDLKSKIMKDLLKSNKYRFKTQNINKVKNYKVSKPNYEVIKSYKRFKQLLTGTKPAYIITKNKGPIIYSFFRDFDQLAKNLSVFHAGYFDFEEIIPKKKLNEFKYLESDCQWIYYPKFNIQLVTKVYLDLLWLEEEIIKNSTFNFKKRVISNFEEKGVKLIFKEFEPVFEKIEELLPKKLEKKEKRDGPRKSKENTEIRIEKDMIELFGKGPETYKNMRAKITGHNTTIYRIFRKLKDSGVIEKIEEAGITKWQLKK
ncbi:MAG: hypothetical protein ACTSRG_20165 [Candidatus Helarchaeota archaeon]